MDPQARNVNSVYILRMSGGLDQYLITELSKWNVFNITTDPQKADAIFTDTVGETFEKKYDQLYPPPKDAATIAAEQEAKENPANQGLAGAIATPQQRLGTSSWGRGRGSIFLVDRKSRLVLWSTSRLTEGSASKQMVEQAQKVVERLRKDLAPPKAK